MLAGLLGAPAAMLAVLSVSPAMPVIQGELALRELEPRWVLNAYLVAFAALMLAAGALGDRFGRRGLLVWGALLFAGSAAVAPTLQNVDQLIASRAVQGIGAALLVPASLGILASAFSPGAGRGFALGLWAGLTTAGLAAGPVLGTWLLEQGHGWEWLFHVPAAAGAAALLLSYGVPAPKGFPGRRLDTGGILLGTLGVGLLAYGLAEGNFTGWRDELTAGALVAGLLLLVIFLVTEARKPNSMVLLPLSNSGTFPAANAVATMDFLALLGLSVFLPAFFRSVLGYTTEVTLVRLVPLAGLLVLVAPMAGLVSEKVGSRVLMTFGNLLAAGGLAMLLQAGVDSAYESELLPALVLLGSGFGLSLGSLTAAAVGIVQEFQAGGAAGSTGTARLLGILLGIGLLGAVVMTAFNNDLVSDLTAAGLDGAEAERIAGTDEATAVLAGGGFEPLRNVLPPGSAPALGDEVVRAARQSFLDAVNTGMLLSIGFLLLAALISLIFVRSHVISLFKVQLDPSSKASAAKEPVSGVRPTDPAPTPRIASGTTEGASLAGDGAMIAETADSPRDGGAADAGGGAATDAGVVDGVPAGEAAAAGAAGGVLPAAAAAAAAPAGDAEPGTGNAERAADAAAMAPVGGPGTGDAVPAAGSPQPAGVLTASPEEAQAEAEAALTDAVGRIPRDPEPEWLALSGSPEQPQEAGEAPEWPAPEEGAEAEQGPEQLEGAGPPDRDKVAPQPPEPAEQRAGIGAVPTPPLRWASGARARAAVPPGDFATMLYQFPLKAGTGTVTANVTGFLRSALAYMDDPAAAAPPAVPLPESIAEQLSASTTADVATLTGYLLLEQRFGRVNPEVRPELAATALVGAARSISLWSFPEGEEGFEQFLEGLMRVVMEGIGPGPAAEGAAS